MGNAVATRCHGKSQGLFSKGSHSAPVIVEAKKESTPTVPSSSYDVAAEREIPVKVAMQLKMAVDTRKVTLAPQASLADLQQAVMERFEDRLLKGVEFLLQYNDSEGDLLTLAGESDWQECLYSWRTKGMGASLPTTSPLTEGATPSSQDGSGGGAFLRITVSPIISCKEVVSHVLQTAAAGLPGGAMPQDTTWLAHNKQMAQQQHQRQTTTQTTVIDMEAPTGVTQTDRHRPRFTETANVGAPSSSNSFTSTDFSESQTLRTSSSRPSSAASTIHPEDVLGHHLSAAHFLSRGARVRLGRLLGQGAYGRVYQAMNEASGHLIAVKWMEVRKHADVKRELQDLDREISLLRSLQHTRIVQYLGMDIERQEQRTIIKIFMEYVPGGSIASLLREMGAFPEGLARKYTEQILQGLVYLHQMDVVHRDIKGANILGDRRGNVKLADFGASKCIAEIVHKAEGVRSYPRGTPGWMAPEAWTGCCKASDIWSMGVTVLEMITGGKPWPHFTNTGAQILHTSQSPDIPAELTPDARDFLAQCFRIQHTERPTAAELLRHSWITSARDENAHNSKALNQASLAWSHNSTAVDYVRMSKEAASMDLEECGTDDTNDTMTLGGDTATEQSIRPCDLPKCHMQVQNAEWELERQPRSKDAVTPCAVRVRMDSDDAASFASPASSASLSGNGTEWGSCVVQESQQLPVNVGRQSPGPAPVQVQSSQKACSLETFSRVDPSLVRPAH